jgi:hypothetical protein
MVDDGQHIDYCLHVTLFVFAVLVVAVFGLVARFFVRFHVGWS